MIYTLYLTIYSGGYWDTLSIVLVNLPVQITLKPTGIKKGKKLCVEAVRTPNLPTNIVGFRGFISSIILILQGGIPRPKGIS